jgi:hypothetical protein
MRVDAEVWGAYKKLCSREKVRPYRPIEEFLRLVVDSDSVLSLLSLMRESAKSRVDGYNAHARVLLDWYTHGKFWTKVQDEDVSVEGMLLDALKLVTDADLRRRIEEALIDNQRRQNTKP